MDTLFLHDLRAETVIGVNQWERRIRQTLSLDLEVDYDARPAAAQDNLADALDYWKLAKRVIALVEASEYQLVETLADAVAKLLVTECRASRVRLSISKPGILQKQARVGVRIERSAKDYT
ncbi:MAG: dihydroneopterin aldolase [Nevskiales bacterium]